MKDELTSFVHAIRNQQPVKVSEIDGLMAMEVGHQIMEKINLTTSLI
jgi:hypothetical protein